MVQLRLGSHDDKIWLIVGVLARPLRIVDLSHLAQLIKIYLECSPSKSQPNRRRTVLLRR
jgi:hypothetical protein